MFRKLLNKFIKRPISMALLLTFIIFTCIGIIAIIMYGQKEYIFILWIIGAFCGFPILLTCIEILSLFKRDMRCLLLDITTIFLGAIFSFLLLNLSNICFNASWKKQLFNDQLHSPICPQNYSTIIIIAFIGIIGYLILNTIKIDKVPPLVPVIAIAAMYLGVIESIVWLIQIWKQIGINQLIFLILFPLNCIIICIRSIYRKIQQWNVSNNNPKIYKSYILNKCNSILSNAKIWPIMSFIVMWPLLGIIIVILLIFGQQPDSIIKAWTETSDWTLSKEVSPQNIYQDEHYLCTVAAGGHRKVVKPIRMGLRHGHKVIVNRQLCIANAFEQVLEEKTPRFHKLVRGFYDKYGFPIARFIKSRWIADFIYIIMKPLELIFLVVLYLVDVNPENRIAVQYMK